MNPSPDLVHSLLHHTRRSEQAIGVDFDSQLVSALYGCLEDMVLEDVAKKNLKVELVLELENIQTSIQGARENNADLDQVMPIAKSSELAIAMMEILNG
jgi:hypothetical protein